MEFKYGCQFIVRLKAIKSIKELLCSLSSYINLQSSNLYSLNSIEIMMMGAFGMMVDWLIEWGWSSLLLLLIRLLLVWSIIKTIHFTQELYARSIGVAIKTRYCSYKSNFHRSDLSLKLFTSFLNCMLGSTIYLGSNSVMIAGTSRHKSRFICYFRIAIILREIVF